MTLRPVQMVSGKGKWAPATAKCRVLRSSGGLLASAECRRTRFQYHCQSASSVRASKSNEKAVALRYSSTVRPACEALPRGAKRCREGRTRRLKLSAIVFCCGLPRSPRSKSRVRSTHLPFHLGNAPTATATATATPRQT